MMRGVVKHIFRSHASTQTHTEYRSQSVKHNEPPWWHSQWLSLVVQAMLLSVWCPSVDISDGGLRRLSLRRDQSCTRGCRDTSRSCPSPRGYCCLEELCAGNTLTVSLCSLLAWTPMLEHCVATCASASFFNRYKNGVLPPPVLNKWSISTTSLCHLALPDALLCCWALAVMMAGANEKNKPVLT